MRALSSGLDKSDELHVSGVPQRPPCAPTYIYRKHREPHTYHSRQFLGVVLGVSNFVGDVPGIESDAHVDRGRHILEHDSHLRLKGAVSGIGVGAGGDRGWFTRRPSDPGNIRWLHHPSAKHATCLCRQIQINIMPTLPESRVCASLLSELGSRWRKIYNNKHSAVSGSGNLPPAVAADYSCGGPTCMILFKLALALKRSVLTKRDTESSQTETHNAVQIVSCSLGLQEYNSSTAALQRS